MDSRRPQPVGCGGKNDNEDRNVILHRLMPFYRLRQTGESTTLLPTATHIDIAAAMALWILADHSQLGVVARMTARIETSYLGGTPHWMCQSRVSMTLLPTATHIAIAAAMTLWILADHTLLAVVGKGQWKINIMKKIPIILRWRGKCFNL